MTRSAMFLVVVVVVLGLTAGCDQQNMSEQRGIRALDADIGVSTPALSEGLETPFAHQNKELIQGSMGHGTVSGKMDSHYPVPDWQIGTPEQHGLSSEGLAEMAELAGEFDSKCLVVIHDGVLVGEWYWDGYDADTDVPDVYSITKSVASALFGIADSRGLLDVDDRVSDYVSEWQGTESEDVTIRELLVHDSGRTFDLGLEWGLPAVADQTSYSLAVGQSAPPGSQWVYTNLGYQVLEAVLDAVLDEPVSDFAQHELFGPIGMTAELGEDASGNATLYSGLSVSCRDLARFGYLYQRNGRWEGEQVLKRNWIKQSLQTSTEFNDAYGIGWWLNNDGHVMLPQVQMPFEYDGRFIPSADEEVFTALGAFGNFVAVDPDDGYIVVRLTDVWDLEDVLSIPKIDALWAALEDAKQ
jgi:CubicO group peptidase (beta-lactamase class C family)